MLNNQVTKAVRLAIAFGAASTAMLSTNAFAAEDNTADKVEKNRNYWFSVEAYGP